MSDVDKLCDSDELVALMRAGDIEAVDRMTRCFGDRLLSIGRKYCRDEDDAQDAVQDALLSAGEHLTDFRGEGSPDSWLARMVTNACFRMRRGRKNDPKLHESLESEQFLGSVESPEDAVSRGELAGVLGNAILDLRAEDRALFLLSEVEGWTSPEISKALDIKPVSVRVRLTRIRARLRPQLEGVRG